jgi:hypothetical protein
MEALMYVLVHHTIYDPERFWSRAQEGLASIPGDLQLHHTLSATDGTLATCLWEAPSIHQVSSFLEPILSGTATNEYRRAEAREGVVVPERYAVITPPSA